MDVSYDRRGDVFAARLPHVGDWLCLILQEVVIVVHGLDPDVLQLLLA